jgi:hypothetical protein
MCLLFLLINSTTNLFFIRQEVKKLRDKKIVIDKEKSGS